MESNDCLGRIKVGDLKKLAASIADRADDATVMISLTSARSTGPVAMVCDDGEDFTIIDQCPLSYLNFATY